MAPKAESLERALTLESATRAHAYYGWILAALSLMVAGVSIGGMWVAFDRLENNQRVAFVKLTPDGGWTIDPAYGPEIDFYTSTVESILTTFVESCFSEDPKRIDHERAVCYQLLSPSKQRAFLTAARKEIEELHKTPGRVKRVRVRAFRHDTFIPTQYTGAQYTYQSTAFADVVRITDRDETPVQRLIIDLTWTFKGREAIQANPASLRLNPLAIEVLDYSKTIDTVGDATQ